MLLNLITFWNSKDNFRVSVSTDYNQFFAMIQAGIEGETFLSVGYSSPNYAQATPEMWEEIGLALDKAWELEAEKPLDEMLPALYNLCKVANQKYNEILWR
jgi:hypothetical protein